MNFNYIKNEFNQYQTTIYEELSIKKRGMNPAFYM